MTEKFWLFAVLPCGNGARGLAAALQSLADQKEAGFEVIVIDGSEPREPVEGGGRCVVAV